MDERRPNRAEYLASAGGNLLVANDYATSHLLIGPPDGLEVIDGIDGLHSVGGGLAGWWAAAGDRGVLIGRGRRLGAWKTYVEPPPTAATTDGTHVWLAHEGGITEHVLGSGDPTSGWNTGTVTQLAIDSARDRVLAACPDRHEVLIIDRTSGTIDAIKSSHRRSFRFPRGVAAGADGAALITDTENRRVVNLDRNEQWSTDRPGFPVGVADLGTAPPLVSVPYEAIVGPVDALPPTRHNSMFYPYALALHQGELVASHPASGEVTRLRDGRKLVSHLGDPIALASWRGTLAIAERDCGRVVLLADRGRAEVTIGAATQPRALATTASGELLVLTMTPPQIVVVVEPHAPHIERRLPLEQISSPRAMAASSDGSVAVAGTDSAVHRIELSSGKTLETIPMAQAPISLCATSAGQVCVGFDSGTISDLATGQELATGLETPRGLLALGARLIVAQSLRHRVTVHHLQEVAA